MSHPLSPRTSKTTTTSTSSTSTASVQLVARDAPPSSSSSSSISDVVSPVRPSPDNRSPATAAAGESVFVSKRVAFPPSLSDEGFGSLAASSPSSACSASSSTSTSSTSTSTAAAPFVPSRGNFRSGGCAADSLTPLYLPPDSRKHQSHQRKGKSPKVTLKKAPSPSSTTATSSSSSSSSSHKARDVKTTDSVESSTPVDTQVDSGVTLSIPDLNNSLPSGHCMSLAESAQKEFFQPVCSAPEKKEERDKPEDQSAKDQEKQEEISIDYFQTDEDGDTPLHIAVLDVQDEDASFFLIGKASSPAQLDIRNKRWSSPIHLAARVGNSFSLRDLILGGANVEERDARGDTALHIACSMGHYDAFLALTRPLSNEDPVFTQYKPPYQRLPQNLDLINYDGLTCFHLAAMHRHKQMMRDLVKFGADVDAAEPKSGRTPLHFAVEKHDVEIVRCLLESCKADVDAETHDGSTALCLAEGRGRDFSSMAKLLRGYGADPGKGIEAWRMAEESDYGSDEDCNHLGINY